MDTSRNLPLCATVAVADTTLVWSTWAIQRGQTELGTEQKRSAKRFLDNKIPTALVSTTKDIVRALKGAYDAHCIKGEDMMDVYLTIINIPGPGSERPDPDLRVHSAVQLARLMGLDEESQRLFKDEYLFEWEIPQRYVVHIVSLQTLHDRGFAMEPYRISDAKGTIELRKRIYEADASRKHLTPCFKCAVHICADGRDLRLDPEVYVQEGCWNPWLREKLGQDFGRSYRWDTACLSKVHINREPSGQLRVAIMVISKRHIKEAYDIVTDKLRSRLQRSMSNNDKHHSTLIREELEEMEPWLNEEINRVNQTYQGPRACLE
ncbi:hypothetical protein BJ875DRAFT_490287 [Amylocarpus encephaloides]|uniref:Uncharacterized protein n=1 Tax=Amylocarpus encephaloides TaxID=45428 RepID=A0A9P8BYY9_9HELO|nr:hypothetical protein BJ875DRAFT_490287 [Amylocarpus encephaloides]